MVVEDRGGGYRWCVEMSTTLQMEQWCVYDSDFHNMRLSCFSIDNTDKEDWKCVRFPTT